MNDTTMNDTTMNDTTMNIWQVKAGEGRRRDYSDVFLQYGVMLVGPGTDYGHYIKNEPDYIKNFGPTRCRTLRQFAKEASKNDLVVLKRPTKGAKWEARAVGKIRSDYSFRSVFSDVDDFQLQHCRQVEWREPALTSPVHGLGRGGGTFCHLNDERARKTVKQLWKEGKKCPADPIPDEPKELSHEELIHSLRAGGLQGPNAKLIAGEIWRLRQLVRWYDEECDDVGEHETRTFLVVPLVKSLGWDEKHMRIEWEHRDVVLLDKPYPEGGKPAILIETKRLWDGLSEDPEQQAKEYAKSNPTCDRFVVTDGIRYKLFTKPPHSGAWNYSHFMNLRALAHHHPYKRDVAGADSFLLKMTPKQTI
jgi:hypothetical protein